MNVPGTQLTRMVDLTHAVDKAPWTVDSCMKLARVHNLFARLGVRHLCVVSDNGREAGGDHHQARSHTRAQTRGGRAMSGVRGATIGRGRGTKGERKGRKGRKGRAPTKDVG